MRFTPVLHSLLLGYFEHPFFIYNLCCISFLDATSPVLGRFSCRSKTVLYLVITIFQLRRECEAEKQKVIQSTMKQMEKEVDRVKEEYRSKISEIEEKHKHIVSDTKKKQWVSICC